MVCVQTAKVAPLHAPGLQRSTSGHQKPPNTMKSLESHNNNTKHSLKGLDSQLWHACAGGMVQLPPVGAKVIYFPQGHGEQAATIPDFPRSLGPSGTIPCRVISVDYLADSETDEVYAKLKLQPEVNPCSPYEDELVSCPPAAEKPASFAKTLTQSDANNGGGFSVPRYCAETIFPRLDYSVDPPVQTVLAKDVHGEVWKFRHIYRGTPRRHLLTTGWSTFVNQKKLVAGDAIVFLRSASGELCVGVRRSMRGPGSGDSGANCAWHSQRPKWEIKPDTPGLPELLSGSSGAGFARNRARVSAKSVLDAAVAAAAGQHFEVVYYPRASTAEFCVRASVVKSSLEHSWYPGMRFKMAFETEDSSRISWFMGTISAVQPADPVRWPSSPWRILQVSWDEPDLLQGVNRVSPWQVELVSTLPMQLPAPFSLQPRNKKFRPNSAEGFMGLPMAALASNVLGQLGNPWQHQHGLSEEIPAGMQGARHERFYGLAFPELQPTKHHHHQQLQDVFGMYQPPVRGPAPTPDLKLRNFMTTTQACQEAPQQPKTATTFLLFGKSIDPSKAPNREHSSESESTSESAESNPKKFLNLQLTDSPDSGVTNESGGTKWMREHASVLSSEEKDDNEEDELLHCKVFFEKEEIGRTLDLSLFSTYEELYDRLAVMFAVDKDKLAGRVVYRDLEGSTIHIGGEPYRNFMQSVRRLTILAAPSSSTSSRSSQSW